ncbi:EAL domain-containing protein [Granulicella sp. WH15]|uniref:putative bifunctional diguanylate cyclase/phosphodiesterase n=1 Tax=Granulicella sp. WH15 TaxID=2602070 RepID=UPI001C709333|nr:EAL domain-containing protein [Granulicella sp. WH15]
MKSLFAWIVRLMSVPSDSPELLKAQSRAFSQQVPMMYATLLTSTWAVAITHFAYTPVSIAIGIPILMTVACGLRMIDWWRTRQRELTPESARQSLQRTNLVAPILSVVFVVWTMMMFPYGNDYDRAHLAFFLAITIIGCFFCLTHLRSAAISVAVIVNSGFIAFFASTGQPTLIASAVTIALVSVAMLIMLTINYRDFTRMVDAQVRTEALSNENFRLANLDSLTSLPNRRAFFTRLDEDLKRAAQQRTRLAVGIIDLDSFKPINDLYGHAVGDKLLIEVGHRLSILCPEKMHLSRLGGDEFALIISEAEDDCTLLEHGDMLCQTLRVPIAFAEATVQIAASVGFAVYPEMAATPEQLFERADYALYHGKRTNRGSAILFSADHDAEIRRDARIEQALQMADLNAELDVVFQPIVDIRQHKTIGFEALARWTSPTLGRVSPDLFIPVAERNGIIGCVTRPLLQKALAAASLWPEEIRLAFNLSPQNLTSSESALAMATIIERSGFDAKRLDLEITETAITHDFGQIQRATEMLRVLGCGISLDDFGTGYSSLSHLHGLPLTKIKVDRSFVTNLHHRPASYKIVKSLLALSRDMGLDCVIEGVETKEEMAALRNLGCIMIQGFYYSPPMAEMEIMTYLEMPIT